MSALPTTTNKLVAEAAKLPDHGQVGLFSVPAKQDC